MILLASCTLGPDYKRPQTVVENVASYSSEQVAPETASMSHWWQRIDDPMIEQFVDQLLAENLDLRMAAERVLQAQEGLNAQRGGQYPRVSAEGSGQRRFTPGAALAAQQGGGTAGLLPDRLYIDDYRADLTVSWTLDVFGRVRRGIEAADARYTAGMDDYEALQHALIGQLVQQRISIAIQNELLSLAQDNVTNRQQFYDLVRRRYDLGTSGASVADIYLAEENVASVKGDVHAFERQRSDAMLLLDVLLNQKPGVTREVATKFEPIEVPLDVPLGVPFDLLDRRPDVRAVANRFRAANAEIGIAIADLYPSFSIAGTLGLTSPTSRNFVSADNLTGSFLGSVMARLFEGGALRANIRLRESQARELALNYEKVVLDALREVESLLIAERELVRELEYMQQSVAALEKAEAATLDRYQRGIGSVRNYLETQQRRYAMSQALLQLEGQRWQNRVALYLALGGDWIDATQPIQSVRLQLEVSDEE
jgi:NodT family efflux transporter outer membrane factor (OMF) lipoprotein